jgi:beta-glucosidase
MEDVPHDTIPNKDNNRNSYNFGFGLNWDGGIKDSGTSKSKVDKN